MTTDHLSHDWYRFDFPLELFQWVKECINEYIDLTQYQPYDKICLKGKRKINGKRIFKLVFSATWLTDEIDASNDTTKYSFPVCYLFDLGNGKFKGNRMNYQIGSGAMYSSTYPVYHDNIKFNQRSKFNKERGDLNRYLNSLEIPEETISSHKKRLIIKQINRNRQTCRQQAITSRTSINRTDKKRVLMGDFRLQ